MIPTPPPTPTGTPSSHCVTCGREPCAWHWSAGLPGTGKTTVAGALADRVGAVLLSSDRIRKELAGARPDRDASAPYAQGLYTTTRTEELYAELLHRAEDS